MTFKVQGSRCRVQRAGFKVQGSTFGSTFRVDFATVVTQSATMRTQPAGRRGVVSLLFLLFAITYLDRGCISVAGPRMQQDLGIDAIGWGWVTGVFTLAYGLFEIPTGIMGDRLGPRRVLTRIVLWWSAFTILTGVTNGLHALLLIRFLFGAGEAGAFPNAAVVVSRWFPPAALLWLNVDTSAEVRVRVEPAFA